MTQQVNEVLEATPKPDTVERVEEIVFTLTKKVTIRGKEIDRPTLEVRVKDNRMYAKTLGDNSVSATIDVTPLWNLFKEVMNPENRV